MAQQRCRTRRRPLLPLQDPSSESESPCFIPVRCAPQPAPPLRALARSRSPLPRLRRSPAAQQRSAAAERAASRLEDQRAAQETARLAARLAAKVTARDAARDVARLAARAADRLAASVVRELGYWQSVSEQRGLRRSAGLPSYPEMPASGAACVRSCLDPSGVDAPGMPGTAQTRSA